MGAVAELKDHPGYKPRGSLLVPSSFADDEEATRRPKLRRQSEQIGRGSAIDPWPFGNIPGHPGYGLSPQRVLRIFRESECGPMVELQDLYDDLLESDGHLRSTFESRISAVAGKGYTIQAGGPDDASKAAAAALEQAIEDRDVDIGEHLAHQYEAPFRGFSASEIIWELWHDQWAPVCFENIPHRRFRFAVGTNELRLVNPTDAAGDQLWPDKWVVTKARHSNLARAGLFRTASWWAMFKRIAIRDWIVFAERFGIPHVLGYYSDEATEDARAALSEALKDLGEGGQAILNEATKIVITSAQRSGDNDVHPRIARVCDAEISKLFLGATLTVESGGGDGSGSWALGKVHENKGFALELCDAARAQQVFRRAVSVPFIRLNGYAAAGARPPRLNIPVFPTLEPKDRVEIMSTLVNELGLEVDGWHVAEQLGFRRPTDPGDAAKPTKTGATPAEPAPQPEAGDQ